MLGVALDRPPQSTAYPLGVGQGALEMKVVDRVAKGLVQGGMAQPIIRTQTPSNASGVRSGPHGQGMPYHSISFKTAWG